MTTIPDHIKKAMESNETPDIVKRQIAEVVRIRENGGTQNEGEENFIMATLELDYAMKSGNRPYACLIFEVIHTYLYESPEAALKLTWQRAAEFQCIRDSENKV
jgi:hypothetical protein